MRHLGYHSALYFDGGSNSWAFRTGEPYVASDIAWQAGHPATSSSGFCAYVNADYQGWMATTECWKKIWFICELELV